MKNRIAFVMAVCVAVTMSAAVAGTTYWKDKDGKITDIPVPGAEKMTVNTPGSGSGDAAADEQSATQEQAAPAKTSEDQAAVRAEQCEQSRKRLAEYKNSSAVYDKNEKGEKRELSSDERVELIVVTARSVRDFCGETQAAQ